MNRKTARILTGIWAGILAAGSISLPALADEWDLSEDGKYWMYYDYSGEPLKDEWIEDQGKTYYVDGNGYMKTGWVTNNDDGNKYYLGEDGAMVKNTFTPDDRFVGPEGTIVEKYDDYRKKVKAEITKAGKKKDSFFLLADLNQDGYRDIVVMDAPAEQTISAEETPTGEMPAGETPVGEMPAEEILTGGKLVEIAVWDKETATFQLAAEFDENGESENSTLYLDAQGEGIWLEISEHEESIRLFQMEVDTSRFRGVHTFSMELDDWGAPEYLIDGNAEEKEIWDDAVAEAKLLRGNTPLTGYLAVNDENIKAQVDLLLTVDDLYLWEE